MANDIRQPRASIACSRNRDPDYIALASTVEGLAAVAVFDALLCAAKDQGNRGTFTAPDSVVAMLCGVPESIFIQSKIKLIGLNWLSEIKPGVLNIRSFEKWNPVDMRGGARLGAGRPAIEDSKQSNDIQNEIKPDSKDIQTNQAPSPSPSPYPLPKDKDSSALDKPKRVRKPTFADNWLPEFRKLLAFDLEDRRCCIALNKLKGVAGEKALTDLIGQLQGRGWRGENPEHVWAYMGAALKSKSPVIQEKQYEDKIID